MYHTCIIHPCFSASLRTTAHELESALDKPLSTEDLLEDLVYELDRRGLEEVRVRRREERTELVLADHVLMHWQPGDRVEEAAPESEDRLTIHEAARAFRYNYRTLQVYIRTGALVATTGAEGITLVERTEMVRLASSLQTHRRHGVQRMARSSWERERVQRGALRIRKRVRTLLLNRREKRARSRARRRGMFSYQATRRPFREACGATAQKGAGGVVMRCLAATRMPQPDRDGLLPAHDGSPWGALLQRALRVRHRKRRSRPCVRLPVHLQA